MRRILSLLVLVGLVAATPMRGAEPATFPLTLLNGVHTNLAPDIAPIQQGPITVRIESPSHRMAVHGNSLTLRDAGQGNVAADFEIELEGEGQLIAHLEALVTSTLEDEVVIPRQTIRVSGLIQVRPGDGGYNITLVDMPKSIEIALESRVLRQLVDLCEGFSSFLPVACDGLAKEASRATIPLPEPGEEVLLPDLYLTDAERALFARFLTSND